MLEIRALEESEAPAYTQFTFPAFRHLLSLEPYTSAVEDPTLPESEMPRKPFALAALLNGQDAGLLLGSVPQQALKERYRGTNAEIMSLFVAAEHRRKGVGATLLAAAEELLRGLGQPFVHGIYMTGTPSIEILENMFSASGWNPPSFRFAMASFSYEKIREAGWIRKVPRIKGYETLPWHEVSLDEMKAAKARDDEEPWIADALKFWDFAPHLSDKATSLGIRYKGELVGWVLNHRFKESQTLRFSNAFVRWDLARLGLALPAVAKSINLMPEGEYTHGTFMTPEHLEGMRAAIAKYVAPWADSVKESRGVYKALD